MKKKISMLILMIIFVLDSAGTIFAAPQFPSVIPNEETQEGKSGYGHSIMVEIKNGNGTDTTPVYSSWIASQERFKVMDRIDNEQGFTGNVEILGKNDLYCQLIDTDAYFVMPFDGFVELYCWSDGAFGSGGNMIDMVFVKEGQQVKMYDECLRPTEMYFHHKNGVEVEPYISTMHEGTNPNNWIFAVRISRSEEASIFTSPEKYKKATTYNKKSGGSIASYYYGDMSFICVLNEHETDVTPYIPPYKPPVSSSTTVINNEVRNGWYQNDYDKSWVYYNNSPSYLKGISGGHYLLCKPYGDLLTFKDGRTYIDGYEVSNESGKYYAPEDSIIIQ